MTTREVTNNNGWQIGEFKLVQNIFLKSKALPSQVSEKELHKIVRKPKSFKNLEKNFHRLGHKH
jgi:hypothetical protein